MGTVLISEVLYDPAGDEPQAEWVEIFNPGTGPIDLSLFKVGDEEESGGGEGMYSFPEGSLLNSGTTFLVANRADEFINRYGFSPDFELIDSDAGIPDMIRYQSWASGNISLGNSGDEILLLDETDNLIDAISWGISTFAFDPAAPDISEGNSLERVPADNDTDSAADWVDQANPDPGGVMVENFSIDLTRDHRGLSSEKFIAPRPTRTPRIRATPTIRPTRPIPGRTPTAPQVFLLRPHRCQAPLRQRSH
jgi:hypothetical protein